MNYAWQFWNSEAKDWTQFDCTECLVLEFDYQAYVISERKQKYCKSDVLAGTIFFDTMKMKLRLTKDQDAQ